MDCLFDLEEPELSTFLRFLTQSLSCTYISLWSHRSITSPIPSNHLICSGGLFDEDQPSSSSLSSAAAKFAAYQQLAVPLDSERVVWGCNSLRVPGFAFKNSRPYIEFKEAQLLSFCFHQTQRDFYQEAKIKSAVFMGSRKGEIELGTSNVISQVNIETGLKELLKVFSRAQASPLIIPERFPQASSSSSSLRSLSTESPESSLIFTAPSASHAQPEATPLQPAPEPYQHALSMLRSPLLPPLETEHSAMTSAFLAVLSSPSSTHSSSSTAPPQFLYHLFQQQRQQPPQRVQMRRRQPSAFSRFRSNESRELHLMASRQLSMMKRSILYYRRLNVGRREYGISSGGGRPTATQLHHMMKERKRREKQNELFQSLRSLLPPGTKKDKSALLTAARNQMRLLQEQVTELHKKNELLQAQLSSSSTKKHFTDHIHDDHDDPEQILKEPDSSTNSTTSRSSSEPPRPQHEVLISEVAAASTSEGSRTVDLRIRVRGVADCHMDGLIIRLLELIRRDQPTVTLISMEARNNMIIMQSLPFTYITMRLQIQGTDDDWDESSFQEAVRRVVADVAP